MDDNVPSETLNRETPQLVTLLKEMKVGLDAVRSKVQTLTQKVKQNQFPTADGTSYLEAKNLLLLGYCQGIIYYLLRKAQGLQISNHPVVRNLVEIRLFLEKIRPIDKKLEYQLQKLTQAASSVVPEKQVSVATKEKAEAQEEEDPLKYRPNPDMLVSKTAPASNDGGGVYRPPKFAPAIMDEDKMSKAEKQAMRREKQLLRQAKHNTYVKDIMDDLEDRPEEVREFIGVESRELTRYIAKRENQERQEEELFIRAPVTKREKKIEKHMNRTRGGMLGLTDGFFDEIKTLTHEEDSDNMTSHANTSNGEKRFKKRKRRH